MKIALSPNCPIFAPEHQGSLNDVLGTISRRWHVLVAPDQDTLRRLLPSHTWGVYGEYLLQSLKTAINEGHGLLEFDDCQACDPVKLVEYCLAPAIVVVENATTDGAFLRCVIEALRPGLSKAVTGGNPRLDIRQAGGIGEVPKEFERHARRRNELVPRNRTSMRRVLAFADSDSPAPGKLSPNAQAVAQKAVDLDLHAYVLHKRTIENYIPDLALQNYLTTKRTANALKFLLSLQGPARDHYPVKKGLKQPEYIEHQNQYPAGTILNNGLGDFLADLLAAQPYGLDESGLRARDTDNELDTLLDLLEEHL